MNPFEYTLRIVDDFGELVPIDIDSAWHSLDMNIVCSAWLFGARS